MGACGGNPSQVWGLGNAANPLAVFWRSPPRAPRARVRDCDFRYTRGMPVAWVRRLAPAGSSSADARPIATTMPYPAPPWHLHGRALLTIHLADLETVRPFVPPELELVSILPGKTLSGLYLAQYQPGSSLAYSELLVTPALVRYGATVGAWISHIYVDNPDSAAGGRDIWGLPKELAVFDWEREFISMSQGGEQLGMLHYHTTWLSLPSFLRPQLPSQVFSRLGNQLLQFTGEFQGRLSLARSRLSLPENSPLMALNLDQPLATACVEDLRLVARPPQVVGQQFAPAEAHRQLQKR